MNGKAQSQKYLLIYWRDASYAVSLISDFEFYLPFLGTGHVGSCWMSLIGG